VPENPHDPTSFIAPTAPEEHILQRETKSYPYRKGGIPFVTDCGRDY
jgi:hypothetical protein